MKKVYVTPETLGIKIVVESMLAGSPGTNSINCYGKDIDECLENEDEILSRDNNMSAGSLWD